MPMRHGDNNCTVHDVIINLFNIKSIINIQNCSILTSRGDVREEVLEQGEVIALLS